MMVGQEKEYYSIFLGMKVFVHEMNTNLTSKWVQKNNDME